MMAQPFILRRWLRTAFAVLLCLAGTSAAQDLTSGDFSYSATATEVTITGCSQDSGTVTIPSSIDGLPVKIIGEYAFYNKYSLTSVTIPDSVTNIGPYAFINCRALTSLTIGSGVTSIGLYAFGVCSGLTSVIIPDSVTSIGDYAFEECSGLTSLTIPNSVTSIGDYAFRGCSSLTSVTIPDAYLASTLTIGISGPLASKALIDGIAKNLSTNTTFINALAGNGAFINALAGNDAFVTAVANKIKSTGGNYGIATQSALSSALTESRADGINSVLSNPSLWTLYTTSQIQNMAVGDLVLTKNVQGNFTLNYDIEQSTDLQTWTPYQALSLPLTGLPTDKAFVRIKAKQ